ncbi:DUF4268 domain-containing protein [Mycoplasma sp. Sp33II]|uniref:DUF4268 domain-containing protein n=1 Tax=unclassified Mycoplasma TaxID=2683645 RepID=UPI003AB00F42
MECIKLGKIKKIHDLRSVWKHEASDFSQWLAKDDNLKILGDTIGIDMQLRNIESKAGSFSADIEAVENKTERKIIIENQLEETDHKHLGQIITYMSVLKGDIAIWIVKKAKVEHKQAIKWLNKKCKDIEFFLVEIELLKIDDSAIAPHFNVVERPNRQIQSSVNNRTLSKNDKEWLYFWQTFYNYAFKDDDKFKNDFSKHSPQPQTWYSFGVLQNKEYVINVGVNKSQGTIWISAYISNNKEFYYRLLSDHKELENEFGSELKWKEAKKDCRIVSTLNAVVSYYNEEEWKNIFEWFKQSALKMKYAITKIKNS